MVISRLTAKARRHARFLVQRLWFNVFGPTRGPRRRLPTRFFLLQKRNIRVQVTQRNDLRIFRPRKVRKLQFRPGRSSTRMLMRCRKEAKKVPPAVINCARDGKKLSCGTGSADRHVFGGR